MKKYFNTKIQSEAEDLLKTVKFAAETKRVQCVLFRCMGAESVSIGRMVGYGASHVRLIWKWYREGGWNRLLGEKRGQNRGKAYMKLDNELRFLDSFKIKAEKGSLVTSKSVHEAHKELLNRDLNPSSTYRMLGRHGWRKIVPRPEHPKHNPEKMKDFREAIFPPGYDPYGD